MLDYKDIITKHYALGMSGMAIAKSLKASPSGVNDFLRAFKACKALSYPLPQGMTNYGIAEAVYGRHPGIVGRDLSYEMPDYETVAKDMSFRKNMTLVVLWNRYAKKCRDSGLKFYSYRQFCENYAKWCEENKETLHFNAVIGQKMEVDFAGKTFQMKDSLTSEELEIVVFVAVLPYSQYIYAEGMLSTKEPQWISVNNNALAYFGGVPALVICDNCKQAVIANRDWIAPELNKDYAEWAEYNHTVILPAKVSGVFVIFLKPLAAQGFGGDFAKQFDKTDFSLCCNGFEGEPLKILRKLKQSKETKVQEFCRECRWYPGKGHLPRHGRNGLFQSGAV